MHTFDVRPQRQIKAVYGRSRKERRKVYREDDDDESNKEDLRSLVTAAATENDDVDSCSSSQKVGSEQDARPEVGEDVDTKQAQETKAPDRLVLGEHKIGNSNSKGSERRVLLKIEAPKEDSEEIVVLPIKVSHRGWPHANLCESSVSASSESEAVCATSEQDVDDADDAAVEALIAPLTKASLTSRHPAASVKRPTSIVDSSLMSQGPSCLLETCNQSEPVPFSELLDTLQDAYDATTWRKAGEASYSEVYSLEGAKRVIKVIPLRRDDDQGMDESGDITASSASSAPTLPERSYPRNVRREVNVTRSLSRTNATFVKLHAAYVARGPYPQRLLRAWDRKQHKKDAVNVRPDVLPDDQLYSVLVLSHAGRDLEGAHLTSWKQAAGLFCQVVKAIADAEQTCHFEHRDLHWGNVVVRKIANDEHAVSPPARRVVMSDLTMPKWAGIRATIIDFTLARAEVEDAVTAHPLNDEAYFTGQGDAQFDVYRQMRDVTKGRWKEHHPRTNALWLHYLATKLVKDKGLASPAPSRAPAHLGETEAARIEVTGLFPTNASDRDELFCHALLVRIHLLLAQDVALPETRARFASASHVLRHLATAVRGLS